MIDVVLKIFFEHKNAVNSLSSNDSIIHLVYSAMFIFTEYISVVFLFL